MEEIRRICGKVGKNLVRELVKSFTNFYGAKVEKKVCLPAGEFEEFLRNPLEGLPCIEENIDLMQEDRYGIYYCFLATGEGRRDGVLVEAEGYDYAHYASYVPDAAALEYDSLSEFGAGLSRLADQMIRAGTDGTGDGNWIFYLDQIQKGCAFSLSENPALAELLADMLVEGPEVRLAYIRSDCLELRFHPEICPNCRRKRRTVRAWRRQLCRPGIPEKRGNRKMRGRPWEPV